MLKIIKLIAVFCVLAAVAMAADKGVKLDSTGEALIPKDAVRVAVSKGNLTLQSEADMDDIAVFYEDTLEKLGAKGDVVKNPLLLITVENLAWRWTGTLNDKDVSVSIYDVGEDFYTIVVLY